LAKQFRFHAWMGTNGLGREAQEIDRFRRFANARQALRATAPQVVAEIQGALFRERAQQPQLIKFF
jgi:hypothetical protein